MLEKPGCEWLTEDNRNVINGILWRLRTGAPWRDIPEKYGNLENHLLGASDLWSASGVWESAAVALAETMAAESGHYNIDSNIVGLVGKQCVRRLLGQLDQCVVGLAVCRFTRRNVPGQRKDHPDDPHDIAEAFDRRGRAQRPQYRADAADRHHDRVQADHRARHAAVRRQGLFHDLRFREGLRALQRSRMGRRADGAGRATAPGPTESRRPQERRRDDRAAGERPKKIKIKLADGKERTIQSMMATTYWSPDGKPISANQFVEKLLASCRTSSRTKTSCEGCGVGLTRAKRLLLASPKKASLATAGRDQPDDQRREERPI